MIIYLVALIFGDKVINVLTFQDKEPANACYNTWDGIYSGHPNKVVFKEIDLGE